MPNTEFTCQCGYIHETLKKKYSSEQNNLKLCTSCNKPSESPICSKCLSFNTVPVPKLQISQNNQIGICLVCRKSCKKSLCESCLKKTNQAEEKKESPNKIIPK